MFKGRSKKQKASTSRTAYDEEGDRPQPMSIDALLIPETIHPWLRFSNRLSKYTTYCQRLNLLRGKECDLSRVVDWEPLEQAGVANGIKDIIRQRYFVDHRPFEYEEWEGIFQIREQVYKELCVEFHCTYEMNEDVETVSDKNFMTFRLGGQPRRMV